MEADCIQRFTELKLRHSYRYVIYGLSRDLKQIEVKSVAPPTTSYDRFVEELKEAREMGECRYAVFDCEYRTHENRKLLIALFFFVYLLKIIYSPLYFIKNNCLKYKLLFNRTKN